MKKIKKTADSSQTGKKIIGGIKMKSDFRKKLEETKWGRKFRQVHIGPGTAVSPAFSAVSSQTGEFINAQPKTRSDFLQKLEKRKWVQKSP